MLTATPKELRMNSPKQALHKQRVLTLFFKILLHRPRVETANPLVFRVLNDKLSRRGSRVRVPSDPPLLMSKPLISLMLTAL